MNEEQEVEKGKYHPTGMGEASRSVSHLRTSCSFCRAKTDNLWMKTVNGVNYLVCKFHKEKLERPHDNSHKAAKQTAQASVRSC